MTKPNSTEIVFVVDRSGSMASIAADMRGGFKAFIEEQKKIAGSCHVTLVRFDNEYELVYAARPLESVPELELEPRGSTALLDALGRTIYATGRRLASMKEEERPSKVLFVVITDGHENASREFRRPQIAEMVKTQRETYSWDFVFLGANQNAVLAATELGFDADHAVNYAASSAGAQGLMRGLSNQVGTYRTAKSGTVASQALGDLQQAYDASVATPESKDS